MVFDVESHAMRCVLSNPWSLLVLVCGEHLNDFLRAALRRDTLVCGILGQPRLKTWTVVNRISVRMSRINTLVMLLK